MDNALLRWNQFCLNGKWLVIHEHLGSICTYICVTRWCSFRHRWDRRFYTLYIYSYSLRAGKSFEKVHQRQGRVLHQHKSTNFSLELKSRKINFVGFFIIDATACCCCSFWKNFSIKWLLAAFSKRENYRYVFHGRVTSV